MLTEKVTVGYKIPVMEARQRQRTGIERKGDAILVLRCVPQCGGRRVPLHVPLHVDQACQ